MEVFDISDMENPTPVGDMVPVEIFIGTQAAANETTLFSVGTFGEFGFCESQIDLIDISSEVPANITRLLPEACVSDIFVTNDLLLVSNRGGVKIFDISNPATPQEISQFNHWNGFHTVEGVARNGDATYILTGEGSGPELRTVQLVPDGTQVYGSITPLRHGRC